MLLTNANVNNTGELTNVLIRDGKFVAIGAEVGPAPGEEVLDLAGKLVIPPFVEPHVHLDSALSAGQPRFNESGTLFEGIEVWSERKPMCTIEDVKDRARAAITKMVGNGTQFVRSHVDCTDPHLTAMNALLELREELRDQVELQLVAFPQEGIMSFPNGRELIEETLRMGADAVGAIPHFEFTREYGVESLNFVIELAQKYDVMVDVHCDEIDDGQARGLETLATRAYEAGIGPRVTASHTTAMHSYNNAYAYKLFRLLRMADLNFVANPLVNTHLQGRFDTYPKRRGVTRVKELLENGNNVAFGHDDIFDPWYPLGDGNAMDVCHMGLHVCQMMGYTQIQDSWRLVSENGARCLGLGQRYGIAAGRAAHFLIVNAPDWLTAINERREILASYHGGKLIARTTPRVKEIFMSEAGAGATP